VLLAAFWSVPFRTTRAIKQLASRLTACWWSTWWLS